MPLIATPASATTYVMMSDGALADQAAAIVLGTVEATGPAVGTGGSWTDTTLSVERVLKGSVPSPLVVRVPGGVGPDGEIYKVWGAPRFAPNERVMLFLEPRADGTYGVSQLLLGAFREELRNGVRLAVRDLSEGVEVTAAGSGTGHTAGEPTERLFDAFADWLAERERERAPAAHAAAYRVEADEPALDSATGKYTLFESSGRNFRWFNSSITWYAHRDGQDGMSGGGFSEVRSALNAWSNGGSSWSLSLSYGGTNSSTTGFTGTDGKNSVLFNDPNDEISGSYGCSSGGVLAIGGVRATSGTGTHNGETFWRIVEGDVVIQDGAGCYLDGNGGKNGALVFAHEVGHALGLAHSCGDSSSPSCSDPVLNDAIMRASAHNDGRGARLGADDKAAMAYLYGSGGGSSPPPPPPSGPPTAPSNLTSSLASDSIARLAWRDNSTDETSFRVERRTDSGAYSQVKTVGAGTETTNVGGLAAGTTYRFRVRACNGDGCSGYTNETTVTTPADPDPDPEPGPTPSKPAAPSTLTGVALDDDRVRLSWWDNSNDEDYFRVERRAGGAWQSAGTAGRNATSDVVSGLAPDTVYTFRVQACNEAGCSGFATSSGVRTDEAPGSPAPPPAPAPKPPTAPTDLSASVLTPTSVRLTWSDRSSNETGFRVEQASGGAFAEVRQLGAGATRVDLAGLEAGRRYVFRVRAIGAAGFSPYSNQVVADLPRPAGTLTAAQVACDAERLEGLLGRLVVAAPGSADATVAAVTLTASGDFAGYAYLTGGAGSAEHHLAFSTNPEETRLLRNPERPLLDSVSFSRNELNSDLVAAGDRQALSVYLDPTLAGGGSPTAAWLEIDNRILADGGQPSDAKPGRGLVPIVTPCHGPLSERDVHVLQVLAKTARGWAPNAGGYELAIYRGEAVDEYRIDLYPLSYGGTSLGRLSARLEAELDGAGRLTGGTLERLSNTAPIGTELYLVPPRFRGETWSTLDIEGKIVAGGPAKTSVDFRALLTGSAWRPALPAPAPIGEPSVESTLTAAEVACDAGRLDGLLERLVATAPNGSKPSSVAVTLTGSGDFLGLAYTGNGPGTPEHHLAFSTNPEESRLLRNPERPLLDSVSFSRNALNSDLVAPGAADALVVRLDPTLAGGGTPNASWLTIDNVVTAGGAGRPADAKPGRGLVPLVESCHQPLAERDVHVLQVLAKLLRGSAPGAADYELAIYRGQAPGTYRVDLYPLRANGTRMGKLAAEVVVEFDGAGRLAGGVLRRLPVGSAPAGTELFLVAPRFRGEYWSQAQTFARVKAGGSSEAAIDFRSLLGGTSWRDPS